MKQAEDMKHHVVETRSEPTKPWPSRHGQTYGIAYNPKRHPSHQQVYHWQTCNDPHNRTMDLHNTHYHVAATITSQSNVQHQFCKVQYHPVVYQKHDQNLTAIN